MSVMPGKPIFISYSHDSEAHQDQVLALAERLREDGLDAQLDQYVEGTPVEGWPRWMLDRLDEAGFVLVVCTETYYRRFRGHEAPGRGKGADWEGALITQEIYDARSKTVKFVPVLLSAGQERFIPEPLRGHTHYELTSEESYQDLYTFLQGKAGVEPRPLGDLKPVSKRSAQPLTFPPASEPTPTMIGVPHRNPFFTGREPLLAQLHQRLQSTGITALAQAAIHGLGGIGKTQTAIEYAHRFGPCYQFVLWVAAEQESTIGAAYQSIARELGLVEATADLAAAVQAMKAWLSHEDGWLLVFDNADDPALLRAYLPVTRTGGKVLLTSRAKTFADVGIREPFRVETMSPEDAVAFLLNRTKRDEAGWAADLARELGYLPLALEQAAAYIDTVGVSLGDYLASFKRRGLQLLEKGQPGAEYPASVATTWNLAFTNVQKASPASAELLAAAAFLVPDAIPIEIFTLGGAELGDLLAEALKGVDEDPLVFWELLAPLERYSLVERLPDNAFKLHRLTQEVVKDSLGEEGRQAWAERVVRALNRTYPTPVFENWKLCDKLQPNARLAYELTCTYKLDSAEAGWLFNQAGSLARQRGDYISARVFYELAVEINERAVGSEHLYTLTSRNNLAESLQDLCDFTSARRLHEQVLEIRKRILGTEHRDTLISRNNLAATLSHLHDLAGARKLHEQNLEIRERVLGCEHSDTLSSRNNLAETLRSLGNFAGARKLHEQVLEIRERVQGSEHPATLLSKNNLAWTLYDQGERRAACELMARVVEGRRLVLGAEHPLTRRSIESLRLFEDAAEV